MTVDQYNPNRAREIERQQFENARRLLWEDSAAVEILMDISSLLPEWQLSSFDEFKEGYNPSVTLTGPERVRQIPDFLSFRGFRGNYVVKRTTSRNLLTAGGLTSRPGFLSIKTSVVGVDEEIADGEVVNESSYRINRSGIVVPGTLGQRKVVARWIRGFAINIDLKPSSDKATQFHQIFTRYID